MQRYVPNPWRLLRPMLLVGLLCLWRQACLENFVAGRPWREVPRQQETSVLAVARPSQTGPSDFDRALLLELQALKALDGASFPDLGRRDAAKARAEALSTLERMEVPLFRADGSYEGLTQKQLKALATELYSKDSVALIQQYVMSLIQPWEHLVRDYTLTLALFQLAQVYWNSSIFGFSLRQAELRFALEKSVGEVDGSLSDYVTKLGSEEVSLLSSGMSLETHQAIADQVAQLYGDPFELWQRLQAVLGPVTASEADLQRLRQSMRDGQVEATPVAVAQLRHLALEGIAFGFLLGAEGGRSGPATGPAHSELFGSFNWSFLGARGGPP